jgi:hypothetical protein
VIDLFKSLDSFIGSDQPSFADDRSLDFNNEIKNSKIAQNPSNPLEGYSFPNIESAFEFAGRYFSQKPDVHKKEWAVETWVKPNEGFYFGKPLSGENGSIDPRLSLHSNASDNRQPTIHTHPSVDENGNPEKIDQRVLSWADMRALVNTQPMTLTVEGQRKSWKIAGLYDARTQQTYTVYLSEEAAQKIPHARQKSIIDFHDGKKEEDIRKWIESSTQSGDLVVRYLGDQNKDNRQETPRFGIPIGSNGQYFEAPVLRR